MDLGVLRAKIASLRWLPGTLAGMAVLWFLFLTWRYAHIQVSPLDEGAYLYKGLLFITGQYRLYQAYGPWSNHMPLSFLLPGIVQVLFGPGLAVGRIFAVLMAGLLVVGIWIVARRMAGDWWALATVMVFVSVPVNVKLYSTAIAQSLTACLFLQ